MKIREKVIARNEAEEAILEAHQKVKSIFEADGNAAILKDTTEVDELKTLARAPALTSELPLLFGSLVQLKGDAAASDQWSPETAKENIELLTKVKVAMATVSATQVLIRGSPVEAKAFAELKLKPFDITIAELPLKCCQELETLSMAV